MPAKKDAKSRLFPEVDDPDPGDGAAAKPKAKSRAKYSKKSEATALSMAAKQKSISISEFFAKNRHLLGFDNPKKALLTTIKEAVDNSLDACEEARILPTLLVRILQLKGRDRFRVIVQDNGPGILAAQVPKIFGKLLYGSKFHSLKQSRGQQGIGISAAGMYGLMTTGKPVVITTRVQKGKPAIRFELSLDTRKNKPVVHRQDYVEWGSDGTGTRVEIELVATYKEGRTSVADYLYQTAIANPHATIHFYPPGAEDPPELPLAPEETADAPAEELAETEDASPEPKPVVQAPPPPVVPTVPKERLAEISARDPIRYLRVTQDLPPEPVEIKPHPYGVELGRLIEMAKLTQEKSLKAWLREDFSRVSPKVAQEILETAKLNPTAQPSRLQRNSLETLHEAIAATKIMNPRTDCVSPIGEELILKGLHQGIGEAEFATSFTSKPQVYRGNPFIVEVGIAFGGDLREGWGRGKDEANKKPEPCRVLRFANRGPLQDQPGACAVTQTIADVDWSRYSLYQPRGSVPYEPMVILVHLASVWVPFTSESKEAIADYPEISQAVKLALQECGRRLQKYRRRQQIVKDAERKVSLIRKYIPHISQGLRELLDLDDEEEYEIIDTLTNTLERSRKM